MGHLRTTTLCHICKFTLKNNTSSHIANPFSSWIYQISPSTNMKQSIHPQTSDTNFWSELVPSTLPLIKKKKHVRLGHTGIVDHSIWFIDTKEKYKNGLDRNNVKKSKIILYKGIMANTSAKQHHTAHTTYQLLSPSCSTRAIQKHVS